MGLETGNFLPDLVIGNPTNTDGVTQGDDHLRLIKQVLIGSGTAGQGSFTPGFTGQYTGTADALNVLNDLEANFVTEFIGRVGVVVAEAGDYTAGQVVNVPTAPIVATDVQAAIDELAVLNKNPRVESFFKSGAVGPVGTTDNGIGFTGAITDEQTENIGNLITFTNDSDSMAVTCVVACVVTATLMAGDVASEGLTHVFNDTRGTVVPKTNWIGGAAQSQVGNAGASCALTLQPGDILWPYNIRTLDWPGPDETGTWVVTATEIKG